VVGKFRVFVFDARVIHRAIDAPELRHRLCNQRDDAVGLSDVAGGKARIKTQRMEIGQHFRAARGVDVRQHQARTAAGQGLRCGQTNAAGCTRDQHHFAGQRKLEGRLHARYPPSTVTKLPVV
jgi:hypothetical protein